MRDWQSTYADFFEESRRPGRGYCLCWVVDRIPSRPDVVLRRTTHDRPVSFPLDGETVRFDPATGFQSTAVAKRAGLSVDNMTVLGITTEALSAEDVLAGVLDDARLTVYVGFWSNPDAGLVVVKRGSLGEAVKTGRQFEVELRGLSEKLQRRTGRTLQLRCDVREFGDARCGADMTGRVQDSYVATIEGSLTFGIPVAAEKDDDYYFNGSLEFLAGDNAGVKFNIIGHTGGVVDLMAPPAYTPGIGEPVRLTQGCPRTFEFCKSLDNQLNFRGFPYMPTVDEQADAPDA